MKLRTKECVRCHKDFRTILLDDVCPVCYPYIDRLRDDKEKDEPDKAGIVHRSRD